MEKTGNLNRKVIFVVENEEQIGDAEKISAKSLYFSQLVSQFTSEQEIRIILPKWATKLSFKSLLAYTEGQMLPESDIKTFQRILWLSDFFKMAELQEVCINRIIPLLSKDNVLVFLEDSFAKISTTALSGASEVYDCWISLYQECLNVAASSIPFLVKAAGSALYKMESIILEELADRAFKKFIVNVNSDNGSIIELLLKYRKMDNPYELLEFETQRLYEKEKAAFLTESSSPTLTWSLTGLKGHFYKDSGPFTVFGNVWELSMWSSQQDGSVSIAIKHGKSGKDDLNSSFKTLNQLEPTQGKGKAAGSVKLSSRKEVVKGKMVPVEEDGEGFPPQCIVTISTLVKLVECEHAGEGTFQISSLIACSKSRSILRTLPSEEFLTTNGKLTIEITLKPEYTYSGILTYVSRNFNWLYNHSMVYKLNKNQFVTLLKHKFLNAKMEEDTLTALCIWLENNKGMANNMIEILENIYWGYISLPSLLDVVRNFPLLRNCPSFKKIFSDELSRRCENRITIIF